MFSNISHPRKRAYLAAFAETGSRKKAAELSGVSREAHYDWMRDDPEYVAAFERAEEIAGDNLEDRVREEAGGERMDLKAAMFLLRGLKQERYGTRRIESNSTVKHQHAHLHIDYTALSDEELTILERIATKARAVRPAGDSGRTLAPQTVEILPDVPGDGTTEA